MFEEDEDQLELLIVKAIRTKIPSTIIEMENKAAHHLFEESGEESLGVVGGVIGVGGVVIGVGVVVIGVGIIVIGVVVDNGCWCSCN